MKGAVVVSLVAGPLAAQDLVYDPARVEDCGAESCMLDAAEACVADTPGGPATPVMSGCYDRALADWDDRLNTAYAAAQRMAATLDGDDVTPPVGPGLVEMQRAWIVWRDASCNFAALQWRGGTGAGPAFLACLAATTARQALRLEAFVEDR